MLSYWHKRLREVREREGYDPKEFSIMTGIPYTVLNRYEKGRGPEVMSGRLKLRLRKVLTEGTITYIETGDKASMNSEDSQSPDGDNIVINKTLAKLSDPNIASILEILTELNKKQIQEILFFALSLSLDEKVTVGAQ